MKRLLSIILVVCMLVPALVACNNNPDKPLNGNNVDETNRIKLLVDGVSQYTLIRSDSLGVETAIGLVQKINSAIRSLTGSEMAMDSDWDKSDLTKKEILVGETNRPESKQVMDTLTDYTFAVKEVGNKIVIAGKSEYTLTAAVNYFISEFIEKNGSAGEGYFSLPEIVDYTEPEPELLVIAEGTKPKYSISYTKECADVYNYSYYDYNFDEQTVATELVANLKLNFGVTFVSTMDYVFNEATIETSPEILLGRCDRTATETAKADLKYNEYTVRAVGNKIVVTGLGFLTTYEAIYKFIEILEDYKITENGVTKLVIPANFNYTGVYENGEDWILDIPEYAGGTLDSVSDLGLDLKSYVLKIKETTVDEYNAYLATLESAGYTKYTTNEINGNLFATYTSKGAGTLRVQYAPVYSQTTIVVEPSNVPLPALESENTAAAVTTTKLVQLKISNQTSENGQCDIFRLNNGKFIVFDGGSEAKSSELIYEKLVELNVLDGVPVIAAWIFTHHHGDHTGTYVSEFASTYKSKVKIESFIYSFPADGYIANDETLGWKRGESSWNQIRTLTKSSTVYTPHAGDVWYFGDLKMTCIYTQDEFLPETFEFYNDSSLSMMFEIDGQKIFITGDASENACNIMLDMYGNYLDCDILQVPHHGHFGANNAFMDATDPFVALIPASRERWLNKLKVSTYTGAAPLRYLLAKKTVTEWYVHGLGTVEFDLPYKGK